MSETSDPTGCKAQAAAKKSTEIKSALTIFGYFAFLRKLSMTKFRLLLEFCGKVCLNLWIATLALWLARNDKKFLQAKKHFVFVLLAFLG